ncbi:MAG: hypothetical protein KDC07_03980, partial [Chitinophagaceae bacterium]|nr:hypothetical protein [Chitinophagaceae bacterium]
MRKLPVTVILIFLHITAFAQRQNNNWCFGNGAAIDFNSGSPASYKSSVNAFEACATVSDRQSGALLFYTDGVRIWNSQHNVMPNGNAIGNDIFSSAMRGVAIVPVTNDSNKYYVFAMDPEDISEGALFYSVVDMKLNGGLGDVVSGKKKIKLGKDFVEGMAAVPTCDGHWLLLSSKVKNEFYAYRISGSGIDTNAVISQMPYPYVAHTLACIKASPDEKKILYTEYTSLPFSGSTYSIITWHDFDEKTGVISNGQLLDAASTVANYYSGEFSEDGTKVYISDLRNREVLQYDLSQPSLAAITASRKTVYKAGSGKSISLLQMGPDNNIYVANNGLTAIDRISNTNAAFPGCVYATGIVTLAPGTSSRQSLPPAVTYPEVKSLDTVYTTSDRSFCYGDTLHLQGLPGALKYLWQDNSTQNSYKVDRKGTYWVTSSFSCLEQTDTYNVSMTTLPLYIGKDTTICYGDKLLLKAGLSGDSTTYLWQDGTTADSLTVIRDGMYYVTVHSGACLASDTISVSLNTKAFFNLGEDTILCTGDEYILTAPDDADTFMWSTTSLDSFITIKEKGTYSLKIERGGCSFKDSIDVKYAESSFNIGKDSTLCNGEEYTIGMGSILNSQYYWSPTGTMDSLVTATEPGIYALTVQNRCGTFHDTALVDFKVCDCNPITPTAFTPNNDGLNDKFGPILKCK